MYINGRRLAENEREPRTVGKTTSYWEVVGQGGIVGLEMTAEDLWEAACKYFQWCDDNPIQKGEMLKSGSLAGTVFYNTVQRPYTLVGFSVYTGISKEYVTSAARSENNNDFYFVAQKILDVMYSQVFDMAMTGVYIPLFAARALGMNGEGHKESTPIAINISVDNSAPKLLENETE